MGFVRYSSFKVLASAYADEAGDVAADVLTITPPTGQKTAHRHVFDYTPKKGMLYVRSRAISSRCNDNYDEFPAAEIKQAYRTFMGKPVFVNHNNADHRRSRGVIVAVALHEDTNPDGSPDTWAEVLMEVDAVRFPKLAAAVISGRIDRTSMGTDVAWSECTYCGNKATNPMEYCAHIPKMKGQRVTRRTASGTQESVLIAERCFGLGFFENSLLVEQPADPTAFTFGLDLRGLEGSSLAHLVATASVAAIENEGLHDVLADFSEAEITEADRLLSEAALDFSDAEIEDADRLLAEGALCSACNPNYGLPEALCSPHAYLRKQQTQFGADKAPHETHYADDTGDSTDILFPSYAKAKGDYVAPSETKDPSRYDGVTIRKDKDGYYVHTHRARSKSYPSPEEIPDSKVKFIESTGKAKVYPSKTGLVPGDKFTHKHHGDVEVVEVRRARNNKGIQPYDSVKVKKSDGSHMTIPMFMHPRDYQKFNPDAGIRTSGMQRTAYGEQKAPAQVNTLRQEKCPVCGDSASFTGQSCLICGYIQPPERFGDPDLDKAKEIDLRGGEVGNTEDKPGAPLVCPNCHATYTSVGSTDPKATTTTKTDPTGLGAPSTPAPNQFTSAGKPPWLNKKTKDPKDTDSAEPTKDGDDEGKAVEDPAGGDQAQVEPEEAQVHAGDTCPNCGVGVLEVDPTAGDPTEDNPLDPEDTDPTKPVDPTQDGTDSDVDPDAATEVGPDGKPVDHVPGNEPPKPGEPAPKDKPDHDHRLQPPADGHDHNDPDKQPVDGHDHKPEAAPEDSDKDAPKDGDQSDDDSQPQKGQKGDDDKKDLPPWLKHKSSRHGAGDITEGSEVGMAPDQSTNPARESRNRLLAALASQQRTIEAHEQQIDFLTTAVGAIAKAAGLEKHPKFAALFTEAADEEGKPVATNDPQALAPDAREDVESIGASPAGANKGVTPDAVTDVQTSNVAADTEPFNKLVDVTQPTPGTDSPPSPAGAHVDPIVEVGTPSNNAFPNNSGWTTSSAEENGVRTFAAIKLARLRKAAGIEPEGADDMVLAQAIASGDDTMEIIARETATLEQVVSSRTQSVSPSRVATRRGLVPQAAQAVERTMPSLAAQGSAEAPVYAGGVVDTTPTDDEFGWSLG